MRTDDFDSCLYSPHQNATSSLDSICPDGISATNLQSKTGEKPTSTIPASCVDHCVCIFAVIFALALEKKNETFSGYKFMFRRTELAILCTNMYVSGK